MLNAAAAGLGIALLPSEVVEDDIRMMRLVRILPDWRSEEVAIHLVFATKRGIVPAVRVLIDYLAEHWRFRDSSRVKKVEATRSGNPKGKLVKAT